ncbi:hypothetical protein TPA0910_15640 [Streptomyces hygroscopicus subsp. sporocinereus]|uniref:Secreted protein n=1 Tax=Streptomyces hygroscopicus TaxID=1912 RepID=A0ABQ3TUW0_STRHY|nr:hypothetical protein [Streptomyces hygroscopicus]GHJ27131.1 hypothetical protein TPA0910_15640 [Streptomyces hygroscopicus]
MDAGLAAVLGALAGSTATLGTAICTRWYQRQTARLAARAEHQRQRREPRHDIYRDFISYASNLRDQLDTFKDFDLSPDSVTDETVQRCNDTFKALQGKWIEVGLVGPEGVAVVGKEIEELARFSALAVGRLQWFRDNGYEPRMLTEQSNIEENFGKLVEVLDNFISLARTALDDDGSLS